MIVGIPKETRPREQRCAATPDTVKKLVAKGLEVCVEKDAGLGSDATDAAFEAAGAKIGSREQALGADIVLKVACPTGEEIALLKEGALLVSMLDPFGDGKEGIPGLAARKVDAICLEKLPRITRAQSMDVLSSQANLAGYKAVVEAASHFHQMFPMMMTAAGSVPPSRVFVLGVGVAGLQAISTARRLGGQVEAFDVRPEVKEQVQSVGAKWIELDLGESGAGEGGYAKELSAEAQERQRQQLGQACKRADVIITTAQIPGRPAPVLVTEETVKGMKTGSVIVDLAAGSGGNCPLSEPDKVVVKHGVTIIGFTDYPSQLACDASRFYSRNIMNFLELVLKKEKDSPVALKLDLEDEIIAKSLVTHQGQVRG